MIARWSYISSHFFSCEYSVYLEMWFNFCVFGIFCVVISFSLSIIICLFQLLCWSLKIACSSRNKHQRVVVIVYRRLCYAHSTYFLPTNFYHFSKFCSCFVNFASSLVRITKNSQNKLTNFRNIYGHFYKCVLHSRQPFISFLYFFLF